MKQDSQRVEPLAARFITVFGKLTVGAVIWICHCLLFTGAAFSQEIDASVALRGEVVEARLERSRQEDNYYLKLRLEFVNTGDKPVIILMGTYGSPKSWWILDRTLSYSADDALTGKVFFNRLTRPANSSSLPMWRQLRRKLNTKLPPRSLTRIIKPKERYVSYVSTLVTITPADKAPANSTVWLRVFLEMWPFNLNGAPAPSLSRQHQETFAERLKRSWKKTGELRLEPLLSEPIPFEIPARSSLSMR